MPESNQYMRLFSGHLKMDQATLTDLFLGQLGNIYCAKEHLVTVLPGLADKASFPELKELIREGVYKIKMQILRMDVIYQSFGITYTEDKSMGIKSITLEAYLASTAGGTSPLLIDMAILTHLRIIESIEITCFNILSDIAASLKNKDVQTMVDENLKSAINTKRMFDMISQEYIS